MDVVFGAGVLDRAVPNVEGLLADFRVKERDAGWLYYTYEPLTPPDRLVVEDVGVTLLINSQARGPLITSVVEHGPRLDLSSLPDKALEETTHEERGVVASLIATVAGWRGFGASTATKLLHKKRPALIPVLDNQAIFGAYMNPCWPEKRSLGDTIKDAGRIWEALDWIAYDLTRPENSPAWTDFNGSDPGVTLVELFDMGWWMFFREIEPVGPWPPLVTRS